jgi:ParB family chromosome partitioning protein
VSFRRVAQASGAGTRAGAALSATARGAASLVHAQGVVLPYLVAGGDVEAIGAVASDRSLPEATRLGAVEALAASAREDAEELLRAIGRAGDDDEDLRKAAWRGLRRSMRARQKAARSQGETETRT